MTQDTIQRQAGAGRPMCSQVTRALGEDPAGSTPVWERCLVMELAGPWEPDVAGSRHFPALVREALAHAEAHGPPARLQCILPDPAYSEPGKTRLMLFTRPAGMFATHDCAEYLVPDADAPALAAALLDPLFTPASPPVSFEQHRVSGKRQRDLLVCTHGSRDACCASLGFPLYKALREPAGGEGMRVWRTSHTGGHRFAPTLIDLPDGRYWAHLDGAAVDAVVRRQGDAVAMRRHYRGWAGVSGAPAQVAEREAFLREGWRWLDYPKSTTQTVDGGRITVRLEHDDGGKRLAYEAVVEQSGTVPLPACMSPKSKGDTPQYRVVSFRRA